MIRIAPLFAAAVLALMTPVSARAQDTHAGHGHDTAAAPASVSDAREGDRVVGSPNAPVTLTAYVSTTCSHCADWHNNELPPIMAKYVDTGLMRIVYRDLLTQPQQASANGAVMARCVPEDRFEAALDALFRNQASLRATTAEEQNQKVTAWLAAAGEAGGLTRGQMSACFDDDANWSALDARLAASHADGVTGTPTFFVNGRRAQVWDVTSLDAVVQPLLAAH